MKSSPERSANIPRRRASIGAPAAIAAASSPIAGTRPDHRDITTATLDDRDAFPPTAEIWTADKIGWETLDPALPHHERSTLNE